jgi:hypothetical protein
MPDQLIAWNDEYFSKLLSWKKLKHTAVGRLFKIENYPSYNNLININSVFSSNPGGMPTDRTGKTKLPFNNLIRRPWTVPTQQWTLEQALEQRVKSIAGLNLKINLFWSGGIDSTTAATAFLKHLTNKSQLRILYSPYSTYEHPEYLGFLKNFPEVELVDISGTTYLTEQYDGVFVTGDGGDELNASLDESFIESYGHEGLAMPWQDFFLSKNPNSKFIEFCEQHFATAGRPVETVLHARWWFYATCKVNAVMWQKLPWFFNYTDFNFDRFQGFFDCDEYENYIYWNIEDVLPTASYASWKQYLKDYCYKFDGLDNWHQNKIKTHSAQVNDYLSKKCAVNDQRWIGVLADGTRINTPSLPFLTNKELTTTYGNSLDYLFNEPD